MSKKEQTSKKDLTKWKEARNLLYVACSRAKINLNVIIKDCDQMPVDARNGFKDIFEVEEITEVNI